MNGLMVAQVRDSYMALYLVASPLLLGAAVTALSTRSASPESASMRQHKGAWTCQGTIPMWILF